MKRRLLIVVLLASASGNIWAQGKNQTTQPTILFTTKSGSGPGECALDFSEGVPHFPGNFVVDDNDTLYLLDPLNDRVLHYGADGTFLRAITIQSTSRFEKIGTIKTVNEIQFLDGALYALQNDGQGGLHLLKMQGDAFVNIDTSKDASLIKKKIAQDPERVRRAQRIKKAYAQLAAAKQRFGEQRVDALWDLTVDRFNNAWMVDKSHIKVTDTNGASILDLKGDFIHEEISRRGNLFIMDYYSKSGMLRNESDINGVKITKYTLE